MKLSLTHITGLSLLILITACTPADDDNTQDNNSSNDTTAYSDAVPNALMVNITQSADDDAEGLSSDLRQLGLESDKPKLRKHISNVRQDIQTLLVKTHQHIDDTISNGQPVDVSENNESCKRWSNDGPKNQWQVLVCKKSGQVKGLEGKAFGWILAGKPLGSQDQLKAVAAGQGVRLEGANGKRGGTGRIAYNFDNLARLTGEGYAGKLGLGYRSKGNARQVILGAKQLKRTAESDTHNALYRYTHVRNKGGIFHLLTHHDLVAPDTDSGGFVFADDDKKELGRAVIAWSKEGKARATVAICGGSVGPQKCVFARQCWATDGQVTFETFSDVESGLTWEKTSCAEPQVGNSDQAPTDGDLAYEGDTNEMGIPAAIDGE